ncbi:Retrovirus-related Pol polyprotein from transposon RE2 [Bienertia sinuspersici]
MFISSSRKIWVQLERRFSIVNGSRKYRLNKQLYELKQNGEGGDSSSMYGKGQIERCSVCGKKNHSADKCWKVIGFPKDHPKNKKNQKGKWKENAQSSRWNTGKGVGKISANFAQGENVITHVGTAKVGKELELKEVLYVPEFQHSLLLVSKLVKAGEHKVNFYPSLCAISNSTGRLVNIREEHDGLYYLIERSVQEAVSRLKKNSSKKETKMKAVVNLGQERKEKTTDEDELEGNAESTEEEEEVDRESEADEIQETADEGDVLMETTEPKPVRSTRGHRLPQRIEDYDMGKQKGNKVAKGWRRVAEWWWFGGVLFDVLLVFAVKAVILLLFGGEGCRFGGGGGDGDGEQWWWN